MTAIYHIGIQLYYILLLIASLFNKKAKLWVDGRKNWKTKWQTQQPQQGIWFHFASLGEFEQGKPLLEAVRQNYPHKKIIITFFSPSGYEIRKNSPLGDYILYLPLDTADNAKDFIRIFQPEMAIFNKYEYWFHFFKALHQHRIPLYVTSAIFRPQQAFFRFYGNFNRKILRFVTHFFVQNQSSANLLKSIGILNYTLSGDTRFDSVSNLAQHIKGLPFVAEFKGDDFLIVAGSTWPEDEKLLARWLQSQKRPWKIVIAPHEIKEQKISALVSLFDKETVIRHSEIGGRSLAEFRVLIIDNIGMLSSLYPYGKIAYIGGGFGAGIHNTLEAAAWGVPVIFGSNYHKFQEAKGLISETAGFTINGQDELDVVLNQLIGNETARSAAGERAKDYVKRNIGATKIIMEKLFDE